MTNPRPFNIRIFVAEGLPDGLRFVEKSNWVGLGIVCPRGQYSRVKGRPEFSGSGVYILVGRENDEDRPTIYVGEAETVRTRLDSHHAKKDFWQQAIIFTTKGDPLNKAEVQYLEARLVELGAKNKRCKLDNANTPQRPGLSEADQAQVEGYLDEMLPLLPVLGLHAFTPAADVSADRQKYFLRGKGWDATEYTTSSGFAVQKGSLARATTVPSMDTYKKTREQLIEDGVMIPSKEGYRFAIDHEFSSPSQAGTVVTGRNTNGREAWKDKKGISLKEHQEQEARS